tara:strand:+ start:237 stop:599 length:363 start_codon:yes stop_codon:yes gene_type:complete
MNYDVVEINGSVAKIQYSDGTHAFVQTTSDMTEADFDDVVFSISPSNLNPDAEQSAPSWLSAGTTRTAAKKSFTDPRPAWEIARTAAYGPVEAQLEYITENGLAAWQTKVTQIKTDNPKS